MLKNVYVIYASISTIFIALSFFSPWTLVLAGLPLVAALTRDYRTLSFNKNLQQQQDVMQASLTALHSEIRDLKDQVQTVSNRAAMAMSPRIK